MPLGFLEPATRPDSLDRIGHYEVLQVLGQGGFGIVLRAFDDMLHRVVAVKVLAPQMASTSPARKRFLREARSSAQVRHENVVQVYEVGETPLPYIAMEFIPGETLQQRLDLIGPVESAEVVRIGRQIADGLAAAHAQDLIHRDIKPGNVLLEGGAGRVKITDFGLARAADDASISQSGVIAGTPMYMAPEQALGHKLDQRADLFSLGSVLYQMASGRPPFRANGTVAVLKRVAEDTPRDIREIVPEVPQWLCNIIAKLHEKKPDERFQTAREVADVLADCEAQLKTDSKLKDFSRISRGTGSARARSGRNWAVVAVVGLLCAVAVGAAVYAGVTGLFRGQPPTPGPGLALDDPMVVEAATTRAPEEERWVQLFNGQDLAGWKAHPEQPGNWTVESGEFVGRGSTSHLFTDRGEYRNFHLRVEAKLNFTGDSGILFRSEFGLNKISQVTGTKYPRAYEAQIRQDYKKENAPVTGSLSNLRNVHTTLTKPDRWLLLEVIATGQQIVIKVDGQTTVDFTDSEDRYPGGHISLQCGGGGSETLVHFRKIEIKEMPPSLPTRFTNGIGMEFVRVPKGKSWLGGGKDMPGDREVEFKEDFYLGKYEVTQEEWEKVMGENPSHFSRTGPGKDAVKDVSDADLKRFPVERVSWEDCQLFIERLNKKEKESGWVYRLPKEAEWEYACRGGPVDKLDSEFDFYFAKPTNLLLAEQANFAPGGGKALGRTCKVGSYESSVLALHDMHGNVWEWCDDAAKGADGASLRVHRGGGWYDVSGSCRAADRLTFLPSDRGSYLGLRLARFRTTAASPGAKAAPSAPFTDADVKRIAALPAEQQVEEVRKELVRRNPGFDGKLETKIEGGVVTEFRIVTDKVTDIAPIRVFNALRVLDCHGTWTGKPNGLLADLSRLEGMNLAGLNTLDLRDTQVSDAGMVYFRDCKNLTGLFLSSTRVSEAGLANFNDCKALIELSLRGMKVTDAGLKHFKDCTGLQVLDLGSTSATAAGLTLFKAMPLRTIRIDGSEIADLTSLRGIALEDIRLTPKSITKGLEVLRSMKSIQTIAVDENQSQPAAEFWERYDKGEFKE
ncbi:MAG: SUMF1/EgtB/PvdO family nonheme iron enzyme [Gemmataceae bacterium]